MTIESASYVAGLDAAYPATGDQLAQGDDHLRMLKAVLKATFPGRGGAERRSVDKSSSFTPTLNEVGVCFQGQATLAVNLAAIAGLPDGTFYFFKAIVGNMTLTPYGTEPIDDFAGVLVLEAGSWAMLVKEGAGWTSYVSTGLATTPLTRGGTGAITRAAALVNLGIESAEISVATAATTDIGAAAGINILLTTVETTVTGFASAAAGIMRKCRASTGGFTLEESANLLLPGTGNIAVAAGDNFEALSLGSGVWYVRNYTKADGTPLIPTGVTSFNTRTGAVTLEIADLLALDGPGSGLDADTLDGMHAADLMAATGLISTGSIGAVAYLDIALDAVVYSKFTLVLSDIIPATDGVTLLLRPIHSGTTVVNENQVVTHCFETATPLVATTQNTVLMGQNVTTYKVGSAAGEGGSCVVEIGGAGAILEGGMAIISSGGYQSESGDARGGVHLGHVNWNLTPRILTGVRILWSAGNFEAAGSYTLYGTERV